MSRSEPNFNATDDTFSLTVDQYGRLWLNTKIGGVQASLDLGSKNVAFEIMAATMIEHGFRYSSAKDHDAADNDDERDAGS